jgi:hypothetical protein
MSDTITLDQALDISYATMEDIRRKNPPLTYAYTTYAFWNRWWKGAQKSQGGDILEGHITLDTEGNARHSGLWAADATVKKNINTKFTIPWRHADGSMAWNFIELDINSGPARIYNVWDQQYKSCVRDLVDEMFTAVLTGPTSSSDNDLPYSMFDWLTIGTDGSTGGFTGYSGHYNDGSTPGATFNRGGIASSATSNARWASYYADHDGNIDDSLLQILDEACRKLNFQAPSTPEALDVDKVNFALYSTNNVAKKLNAFYAKSDDNMGYRPEGYQGVEPAYKGIPLVYVPPLDTANTSVYGTDPILGMNHNLIYPVVHTNWNFKISKRPDSNRHNVMTLWMDVLYAVFCENPRSAGFLVNQQ